MSCSRNERAAVHSGSLLTRVYRSGCSFGPRRAVMQLVAWGMIAASIEEKFSHIFEHWRPKVVAELNGQEVKLVKFLGDFLWHQHDREDEMFLVWRGEMRLEFRDKAVKLRAGEYCVVPHGVEHRTCADQEVEVIVFEPAATRNTGNRIDERFTAPNGVRL